jgi:hypothetical protein
MDCNVVDEHAFPRDLPQGELEAVARVASPREFATDEAMMTQGDFGHCLFLVKTSTADVSVECRLVRSVGPGDAVDEVAVLSSGRRTARVVAPRRFTPSGSSSGDAWALATKRPSGPPTSRRTGRAAERGDSAHAGRLIGIRTSPREIANIA